MLAGTNVTAALNVIDRWMQANRPDYYRALLPGASEPEVESSKAKLGLALPEAFWALYRWRNGQPHSCYENFQSNWMFMSLEDVVATKDLLDGLIDYDFQDFGPNHWRLGWVPFLDNGGGSYRCVDLVAADGGQPGQLVEFWKVDKDRPVVYPSFDAWLHSVASAMQAGTFRWNE